MKVTNPDEPNEILKQALENLETFAKQIKKELIPNLSNLKVQQGKVIAFPTISTKKKISIAFQNIICSAVNEQSAVLDEILRSSDVIKSYFPLIQVMEEGTPEQKKFAAYAKSAIELYNHVLDEAANTPPSWQQKIVSFIYKKSNLLIGDRLVKIDLPQNAHIQIHFPDALPVSGGYKNNYSTSISNVADDAAEKISQLRDQVIPSLQAQRQTLELYNMKIIALLERNQLFSKIEARNLVFKTPTFTFLNKESQLLTISQQLTPLPGQLIEVSATFQMDNRTHNYSIFHSDNLSIESTQTGFPHPLQHHGWALHEILVPKHLHRPKNLHYFPALFMMKGQIAQGLLPNGHYVEKARNFLQLKKLAFQEHKIYFLTLHEELALAIAKASDEFTKPALSIPFFLEA